MPWPTGKDFAEKHNRKLKGVKADKAAKIATAMVERGVPDGEAIATANKRADSYKGKGRKGHNAAARTGKTRSWTGR